ncbi:MAG: thioesterase II family protein [Ruminiclostridium sp.]
MKLFMIPFAGGMSSTYLTWKEQLKCEVLPIILRGRESRVNEALYTTFSEAVEDIKNQIISNLESGDDDFALFGHSMGAFLTFEVYHALRDEYLTPEAIFLSGRKPPQLGNDTKPVYRFSPEDLKEEMIGKGGMDARFFDNEELVKLFIPVLRADYKILYDYKYKEFDSKIKCRVIVLNGEEDAVKEEEMYRWNELAESQITYYAIPGNHFFTLSNPQEVCKIVENELQKSERICW